MWAAFTGISNGRLEPTTYSYYAHDAFKRASDDHLFLLLSWLDDGKRRISMGCLGETPRHPPEVGARFWRWFVFVGVCWKVALSHMSEHVI